MSEPTPSEDLSLADTQAAEAAAAETEAAAQAAAAAYGPMRIILAKIGYDGHDRGVKVVARILRDAGFEVIYLGLRQTTADVVAAAQQEDADAIGLSLHNAGHMTLAPRMVQALAEAEVDIPVIVGGIVPDEDVSELLAEGVATILTPGASADVVVRSVRDAILAAAA